MFDARITQATRVIYSLRLMMRETVKDKENNPQPNPSYVPGLKEPTPTQVNNYINNVLKKNVVKPNFSYADLQKWVNDHSAVPDERESGHEHEPYVISSYIDVNDKVPKASVIRIAISTKFLISLARKRNHICADTTWKTNWNGKFSLMYS